MNNLKNEIDRIGIEAVINEGAAVFDKMIEPLWAYVDQLPKPPPPWPRRLYRWLARLWRGAAAWVVEREEGDSERLN